MRVVVLTQVPPIAGAYKLLASSLGHEVTGVIVARTSDTNADAFLEAVGDETDIVFATSKHSLAPLLRAYEADVGLCTGFPWLVPQTAIDTPRLGIVNGHTAMLPHGRGPHPWAWAARNGETEVGLTYHFMDASFDTGNILAQQSFAFDPDDTESTLIPKYEAAVPALLMEVFAKLEAGDPGVPQDGGDYQSRFEQEYAIVDPGETASGVHRQVRAWSFVPDRMREGPVLERDGTRIRILESSLSEVAGAERLDCADGPLWIVETEVLA